MEKIQSNQKRGRGHDDRTVISGIFGFYFLCICAVLGLMGWWFARREATSRANATATSAVIATQQAKVTATAAARATEQGQYEFVESFDVASARWHVGVSDKYYGDILYSIKDGTYIWDVRKAETFSFSADFYKGNEFEDFDAYLDLKFIESDSVGSVCAGLAFRKSPRDWLGGAFVFSVCNDSYYRIQYYDRDGWQAFTNSDHIPVISNEDWNRIEVSARGDNFVFTINNEQVFELLDDRLPQGGLAIYLEVPDGESAEVWFDNFGFQSR